MDPLLLVAALALIAFSIFTLGVATQHDVPGDPYYYVSARRSTRSSASSLMFAVARIDYSRFRELRVGIYSLMVASIILVCCFGARRARLAALDRAALLQLPAVGARQGAA